MTTRLCPECDARSEGEVCPKCGTRTFFEAESDSGIDPLLGRVLDQRYRIEERIGRGGMGTVYRAVQIAMNKVVAVKVMNPELARNTDAVKRFHREAKAATAFDHPHAIRLIDFGQAATRELFMVMEFLDGRSLSKVLKDEAPFPVVRAAKVAGEIAKALASAHNVGLVHRDMKPDNVFLLDVAGDNDFVKVLDFGIAKFVSGTGDSTMTRTGLIVGTPQFMAPEQAQADKTLTPAVDVYALGVMLYAMLAGRHPFKGDTPLEALMAHVNQPVPDLPATVFVPDDLRVLAHRMLAKDPESRPTAAEVVTALERVRLVEMAKGLTDRAETSPPAPLHHVERGVLPRAVADAPDGPSLDQLDLVDLQPRRRWVWVVAALLMVVAIGAFAWLWSARSPSPSMERGPGGEVRSAEAPSPKVAPAPVVAPVATPAPLVAPAPVPVEAPVIAPAPVATPAPAPAPETVRVVAPAPLPRAPTQPVGAPLAAPKSAPAKPRPAAKPEPKKKFEEIW